MANYGTVSDANAYHLARGNTAWTGADDLKLAALVRGTSYIDGRFRRLSCQRWLSMFPGRKSGGYAQETEWGRDGATDNEGNEIPDGEIPVLVENATYEAALLELQTPGVLSPIFIASQLVRREKVGPIEVEYTAASATDSTLPNLPIVPIIDWILAPLLRIVGTCSPAVRVV